MTRRGAGARRAVAVLALILLTAECAGCSGLELRPKPPTEVQPVFASDDEAVAAAVATYERYLVLNAEIDADGGADAERVLEVATKSYGLELVAEYRSMRHAGGSITGAATLVTSRLIEIDRDRTRLTIAMCVDLGEMRIFNAAGEDVTPPRDEGRTSFEVAFRSANSARVLLDGSAIATGDHLC
jgi:hypothetical protein